MPHYVDTSALVKLVVSEPETPALEAWLAAQPEALVSSDLARAELVRTVRRSASADVVRARAVLESITLLTVRRTVFDAAGRLDPTRLRTLDALHLASALELGDDLAGIVTYDHRLAEAARTHGVAVIAPS